MNVKHWLIGAAAMVMIPAGMASAEVTLPLIFSNNMVLQADMADSIWGTASPGENVAIELNGQKKSVTADKDGAWEIKLDPQKAGGPYDMTIGDKTIKNVLVGEVWHASGQSNMRFPLNKADTGAADIPKANFPDIHYYLVDFYHPQHSHWEVCSPASAGRFSAVAFYFARDLHDQMKVPVAIVDSSVSGACAEQFISPDVIAADPELEKMLSPRKADITPSDIYKASIKTIIPYTFRGVIWYQGEGNRDYPVTYQKLFPLLIQDWRKEWGQGNIPFIFVQLANYGKRPAEYHEGKDAALRDAQRKTLSEPNTAMAVSIDCAPANDPKYYKDPHYPNKKPVGDRLFLAARALAYGEKIEYSGPLFADAKFDGGKATVSFTHIGAGLDAKGGPLKGFALAGADHKWVRAEAEIDGDHIVVHSDKVPAPVAVRYAFEPNPECNLYNKDGLPASSFRSDDWISLATKDGE